MHPHSIIKIDPKSVYLVDCLHQCRKCFTHPGEGAVRIVQSYGTDYPTPDGTCVRDYVHVMDLVDAHIKGMEWLLDGKGSRVFNLGTGTGFSVKEVISACKAVTGRDVPHSFGLRRAGDAASLVSGSRRAAEELGWLPERSTLRYMIADAWRWFQTGGYSR